MTINNTVPHDFFELVESLHDGDIHLHYDPNTQLRAIIVIDSTQCGPALGGCRCLPYSNSNAALQDCVRLAKSMTLKSSIMDLPLGGGKSVLLRPPTIPDREAYFKAYGKFVNTLGGRYITAVDSGTQIEDMDIVASQTPYVADVSTLDSFPTGDPSPFTAVGVFRGIQAALQFKQGQESLENVHIAIQGVGHVGYPLAKLLHEQGAKLTVCDLDTAAVQRCVDEFEASACAPEAIYDVICDVFAPCGLGGIINDESIPRIQAPIIAGAANNQLKTRQHAKILHQRNILYAPDYVINSGGLVYAHAQYMRTSEDNARQKTDRIFDIMLNIFERGAKENRPTSDIADQIALEKLNQCPLKD